MFVRPPAMTLDPDTTLDLQTAKARRRTFLGRMHWRCYWRWPASPRAEPIPLCFAQFHCPYPRFGSSPTVNVIVGGAEKLVSTGHDGVHEKGTGQAERVLPPRTTKAIQYLAAEAVNYRRGCFGALTQEF
jgi:hypothetical protein